LVLSVQRRRQSFNPECFYFLSDATKCRVCALRLGLPIPAVEEKHLKGKEEHEDLTE